MKPIDSRSKIISTIAIVAMVMAIVTTIPTANASSDGGRDGKAQGHRDAMNGEPADGRCPPDNTNDYCAGYKIAYNIEYYWTKIVQDK